MADNQNRPDDDEDDDQNQRGNRRGNRNQQNQKGKKPPLELSSDPSYLWRFIKNLVGAFGNQVGKVGFDIGFIQKVLAGCEKVFGEALTGMGVSSLAALIQNPEFLKQAIRKLGFWPDHLNALIDEFIDDVFEGVRMAYSDRNRLKETDVGTAVAKAQDNLHRKLCQSDYADAFLQLTVEEQALIDEWIAGLTDDERKKFDFYRVQKIKGVMPLKALLHHLRSKDVDKRARALGYLERLYGPVKEPVVTTMLDGFKKTVTAAVKAVGGVIPDPKVTTKAANDMMAREFERDRRELECEYPDWAKSGVTLDQIKQRALEDHVLLITAFEELTGR